MHVNSTLAHYQLPLSGAAQQTGTPTTDPVGSPVRLITGSGELSSATWPTTVEVPPKSGTPLEFGDWLARTANYRAAVRSHPTSQMPPTALQNTEDEQVNSSPEVTEEAEAEEEKLFGMAETTVEQPDPKDGHPRQADDK